jgi:hypothetical protein
MNGPMPNTQHGYTPPMAEEIRHLLDHGNRHILVPTPAGNRALTVHTMGMPPRGVPWTGQPYGYTWPVARDDEGGWVAGHAITSP